MYKMLIVEDDAGIAKEISTRAEGWGIKPVSVSDFRNVAEEFAKENPHIVLMDISLPFYDGYYWCEKIRRVSSVPIIFISSAADNMNIVMAVNMGADDFIAKPFDLSVLMAKVSALLRRSYDFAATNPVLEWRDAFLTVGESALCYGGEKTELTKNEYRILFALMENRGRVVSREKLMEKLWQTDSFVDENTLTVNINRLRKKLETAGLSDFIMTKFGEGYYLGDGQ
mgnify:FL=1